MLCVHTADSGNRICKIYLYYFTCLNLIKKLQNFLEETSQISCESYLSQHFHKYHEMRQIWVHT